MGYLPIPVTAELAPGADPSANPSAWNFTDEGVRWRAKDGLKLTTGEDDEDDETKPGSAEATFDDRDGKLSPRNVLGEWYGLIDNNTPIRFVLGTVEDDFARVRPSGWGTEPRSELTWLHTDPAQWSTDGVWGYHTNTTAGTANYALLNGNVGAEVDVYNTAAISATPTGGSWVHATIVRLDHATGYMYRAYTEFTTAGTIVVKIAKYTGSTTELVGLTATGVTYIPGDNIHTHVQAVGKTIQIKVWKNSDPEPDAWNASVADGSILGSRFGFYEWRLATGPASITLSVRDLRIKTSLWSGQVPEWPVRWPSKSGADCIAPIAASGALRWLEQTTPPLVDPISQQLSAQDPQGYWPLQDGAAALKAGSALPRPYGVPASATDVTFGNDDAPPGALSSVSLNTVSVSRIDGSIPAWRAARLGFANMVYARFPSLPGGTALTFMHVAAVGSITRWIVQCDTSTFNVRGFNAEGTEVLTSGGALYTIDPTQWFAVQLEASWTATAGGTVTWALIWHQIGSDDFYSTGGSFLGFCDLGNRSLVQAPVDGTLVSHLWCGPPTLPFVDGTFMQVSAGYAGELDTDRVARVFGDAGIEVIVEPGDGVALGAQPRGANAIEVARDAELAGWGKLIERGPVFAYLPYSARINRPVALALDFDQGHIAEDPEPVDDDLEIVNRWTSRRPDGSERTAESADSIARKRLYADGGEVNVHLDEQLDDDAGWHVAIGSRNLMRWPRIVIDLHKNTSLIGQWLECRQGSRVTVANLPEQVAGEVADLIITGWEQTIRNHYWRVELFLMPAVPWVQVGTWGTARGDSTSTTLAEALDDTETAIDIVSTYREHTWASAGGYTWNVNGEPMTVTSVTSPAGSPGAYTQTATVTRHPTLAKAHASGEQVRLDRSQQARWGLRH